MLYITELGRKGSLLSLLSNNVLMLMNIFKNCLKDMDGVSLYHKHNDSKQLPVNASEI